VVKAKCAITTIFRAGLIAATACAISATSLAQSSDNEARYSALLGQIENAKLSLLQREAYVANQRAEMESLQAQISGSREVISTVQPMLEKMVAAIELEIQKDVPFKLGERLARLDKLKEDIASSDVRPSDKMRSALRIYDIEVGYGQTLEAYGGNHPTTPGARLAACEADIQGSGCGLSDSLKEKMQAGATLRDIRGEITDGTYLRYGRLSLTYQQFDGSEALRYDPATKEWVALSASQALELERGLRTARGEAAPTVVNAPVYVAN
jgi:hypothetical protein